MNGNCLSTIQLQGFIKRLTIISNFYIIIMQKCLKKRIQKKNMLDHILSLHLVFISSISDKQIELGNSLITQSEDIENVKCIMKMVTFNM